MVFAICSCSQDKFVIGVKPGYAHLQTIKFLHQDKFLAPRQLVPRHCTSDHLPIFRYRDNLQATYQLCTATLVMLNRICTRTAKTRAIPFLHRDNFSAKVPGPCPVLSSGNTPLQAGSSLSRHNMSGLNARPSLLPGR